MKKLLLSFAAALMGMSAFAGNYEQVTTIDGVNTTDTYVLAYIKNDNVVAVMGDFATGKTFLSAIAEGFEYTTDKLLVTTTATPVEFKFVAGTVADKYAICDAKTGKYLAMTKPDNVKMAWKDALEAACDVSVKFNNDVLVITFENYTGKNQLMYNSSAPRFANYGGTQQPCTLFKAQVGGVAKYPAGLSFSESTYSVKFGQNFTAPELTKATDAAITWKSSVPEVATVDENGNVEILAIGVTEITATAAENDSYYGGSASYTLEVIDPDTFWAPECKDKPGEFTFVTLTGDLQPWSVDDRYGLKASGFKNSANNASDAVAASPELDFSNYIAPMSLSYRSWLNYFTECTDEALAPYISVVAKEVGTDEWVKIGSVNAPEAFKAWYDCTTVDLAQFAGKKVQIGFRYVSTTECAGTWEVDNVVVKARAKGSAVDSIITDDANAPVEYFNLQGIRVANPDNGIYIRRQGSKVTKVLVK